jgi:GNAT superfamily N-acetyltransferase
VGVSYDPVAEGGLAAVVTFLEMFEPPSAPVPSSPLRLSRIHPTPDEYRRLFRLVGARWLWFSRLVMTEARLRAIIDHRDVQVFAVLDENGSAAGMVELDFREPTECELAFIGLVPELAGQGHGRWLLSEAVERAWADGIGRVQVHTCTLDHPAALAAYIRAGFTPYRRAIERFPDPRLLGILPRDCAPQVPLLEGTDGSTS